VAVGSTNWTRLAPGDHVAAFYHDDEEKAAINEAFAIALTTSDESRFSIGCGGRELESDVYLSAGGSLSLPRLKEVLRRRTRDPDGDQRPVFLAADVLPLAERLQGGSDDLALAIRVWEEAAEELAAEFPLTILCLYDWQRIDDGLAVRLTRCHSVFYWQGRLQTNPVPLSIQAAFAPEGSAAGRRAVGADRWRQEKGEWLTALREIAEARPTRPPEDLIDLMLQTMIEIFAADAGVIRIADPASTVMPIVAHRGLGPETAARTSEIAFGRNLIAETEGFSSVMSLPIRAGGRVLGVIDLAVRGGRRYTVDQFERARSILDTMNPLVLQAIFCDEAVGLAHRMEAMARLTAAASARLNVESARTIAREAAFAAQADACAFWLLDPLAGPDGGRDPKLVAVHGPRACLGLDEEMWDDGRGAFGPAFARAFARALEVGRPIFQDGRGGLGRVITVPLAQDGRTLGALTLARAAAAPPFNAEHLARASLIGTNLAMALFNRYLAEVRARQIEDVRQAGVIGNQIVSILDIDQALAEACRLTSELIGGAAVRIWLPGLTGGLEVKAAAEPDKAVDGLQSEFGEAERRRLVEDAYRQCRTVSTGWGNGGQSTVDLGRPGRTHLCLPLKGAEAAIGVLEVQTRDSMPFEADRVLALESIADHIVAALRNAELFEEMRRARHELELLMTNMGEALMVIAPDHTVTFMNAAAIRQYGNQIGRRCHQFFHGSDEPCRDCPLPFESSDNWTYHYVREAATGRVYDVVASGLQTSDGRVVVAITRDITDDRRMHAYLAQHERMVAMGEMATGIAHNFNNILTSILGTIDDFKRSPTVDKMQPALRIIERAAADGADLIRRLQASTRINEEPGQRIDLATVIQDAAHVTRPKWKSQAERVGRAIEVDCRVADGLWVRGHPAELRQVFINLIMNAIDALPQGGRIMISAARRGSMAEVRVTDNGVGMAPNVRARLFQPFFSTKGKMGSGLGLSTAYNIISQHGGSIGVESAEGVGTTFTVVIPLAEENRAEEVAAVAEGKADLGLPLKVLVVDDDQLVLEVLASLVTTGGHRVVTASRGAEAVRLLGEESFDVVLTDLGMPKMSGWDVAREVRRRSPGTGIILLTGWGAGVEEDEAKAGLVDLVLAKPVRVNELLSGIARIHQTRLAGRPKADAEKVS